MTTRDTSLDLIDINGPAPFWLRWLAAVAQHVEGEPIKWPADSHFSAEVPTVEPSLWVPSNEERQRIEAEIAADDQMEIPKQGVRPPQGRGVAYDEYNEQVAAERRRAEELREMMRGER
jgi:hypothetical protein